MQTTKNRFIIEPILPKIALRSSSGGLRSDESDKDLAKNAQERPKSHPREPKKARLGGQTQKGFTTSQTNSSDLGVRRLRGASADGVRGRKLPEFGGVRRFTKHCLERFAPIVNDGCGGLSSLRATTAPVWEFDVGGTSLQASFRHYFAGSRHDFTAFRWKTEPQVGGSHSKVHLTNEF